MFSNLDTERLLQLTPCVNFGVQHPSLTIYGLLYMLDMQVNFNLFSLHFFYGKYFPILFPSLAFPVINDEQR